MTLPAACYLHPAWALQVPQQVADLSRRRPVQGLEWEGGPDTLTCSQTPLPVRADLLAFSLVHINLIQCALLMHIGLSAAQADLHQLAERRHIHV